MDIQHCVKSVRIRSFSGPYFPSFGLNTHQKNSEYGHFSRSAEQLIQFTESSESGGKEFIHKFLKGDHRPLILFVLFTPLIKEALILLNLICNSFFLEFKEYNKNHEQYLRLSLNCYQMTVIIICIHGTLLSNKSSQF